MSIYNLISTIQQNAEFRGCVYARRQQVDEWAGRGWGWREWIYCQLTEPWIQADEQRKPQEALSLTVGYFSLSLFLVYSSNHTLLAFLGRRLSLSLSLSLSLPPLSLALFCHAQRSTMHIRMYILFSISWASVSKHYQLADKAVW